jgi:hypothetical protein
MTRDSFDPIPDEQNVVLVDAATLQKAQRMTPAVKLVARQTGIGELCLREKWDPDLRGKVAEVETQEKLLNRSRIKRRRERELDEQRKPPFLKLLERFFR